MDKAAAKARGPYQEKLNATAEQKYLEKIRDINDIRPYELPAA